MTDAKHDLTTMAGLCEEIQLRATSSRLDRLEAERILTAENGVFVATLGLVAELFARLEALERQVPPTWIGEVQPNGAILWRQRLECGAYVESGPPPPAPEKDVEKRG